MSDVILSAEELAKWTPKLGTPNWVQKIVRSHEALRAELDEARRGELHANEDAALIAQVHGERIKTLTEALARYGGHVRPCDYAMDRYRGGLVEQDCRPCTCGFDDALAGEFAAGAR